MPSAPFRTLDDVVNGLSALESDLRDRQDRRCMFLTLYRVVSSEMRSQVEAGAFDDPEWVHRYAVAFANLYREAFDAYDAGQRGRVPKAWLLCFDAAAAGRTLVLQNVFLGVNAHVNHDLAYALFGVSIDPDRARRYRDHSAVNRVLGSVTERATTQLASLYAPGLTALDDCAGELDEMLSMFSLEDRARERVGIGAGAGQRARRDRARRGDEADRLARCGDVAPAARARAQPDRAHRLRAPRAGNAVDDAARRHRGRRRRTPRRLTVAGGPAQKAHVLMKRDQIEELFYGKPEQQRRFTQDFPILPDVWIEYGQAPDRRVEVLLTPHNESDAPTMARALRERLEADQKRGAARGAKKAKTAAPSAGGRARVLFNESVVLASLTFRELLRDALPLTNWWQRVVAPLGSEWTRANIQRVAATLGTTERGKKAPPPTGGDRKLLQKLIRVVGSIELERQGRPITV